MLTTVTLSTILNQLKVVLLADFANLVSICNTTIEVHDRDSLCLRSDGSFNKVVINLKGVWLWLNAHWHEVILSDSKDGCDVCIGRYDNLITWLHHAHLDVRTEDPDEGIKTICATDGVLASDELRVMLLKLLVLLALKVPAIVYYSCYSFVDLGSMKRCHVME